MKFIIAFSKWGFNFYQDLTSLPKDMESLTEGLEREHSTSWRNKLEFWLLKWAPLSALNVINY